MTPLLCTVVLKSSISIDYPLRCPRIHLALYFHALPAAMACASAIVYGCYLPLLSGRSQPTGVRILIQLRPRLVHCFYRASLATNHISWIYSSTKHTASSGSALQSDYTHGRPPAIHAFNAGIVAALRRVVSALAISRVRGQLQPSRVSTYRCHA